MNLQSMDLIFRRELGMKLRNARERRNMTQKEVAEVVGVARTTIINIEYGYTKIKPQLFNEICDCLGISNDLIVTVNFGM